MNAQPVHYLSKPEHYERAPIGTEVETTDPAWNGYSTFTKVAQDFWAIGTEVYPDKFMGANRRRVIRWGNQTQQVNTCNAQHPDNPTAIPCMRNAGHNGNHASWTGCAGGKTQWKQQSEPRGSLSVPRASGHLQIAGHMYPMPDPYLASEPSESRTLPDVPATAGSGSAGNLGRPVVSDGRYHHAYDDGECMDCGSQHVCPSTLRPESVVKAEALREAAKSFRLLGWFYFADRLEDEAASLDADPRNT